MKLKIIVVATLIIVFLASCGNKKSAPNDKNLPADLLALNQKLESNPNDIELLNQRATYYVKHNETDLALNDISKAIKLDSLRSELYITLSDVYFQGGKFMNCKDALNKAILRDPTDKNAYVKLAELCLYYKDYDETLKNIDKALEIDRINPKAYFIRGFAHKENGDTTRAIKNFMEATSQDPNYYDAYLELGLIHAYQHKKQAVDYYQNALKVRPNSVEALYDLGMYYQENNDYDKAIVEYTTILQFEPKNRLAHFNIGFIYLEHTYNYEKAVKYFSDAIACDSNYVEAIYNRGLSYERLKDLKNARLDYAKALHINSEYDLAIEGMNRLDNHLNKSK
ncbi:MAG: tetratricopeptide repeat protein [Bacteroidota bacterium]